MCVGTNRALFILGKYYDKLDKCDVYPIAASGYSLVPDGCLIHLPSTLAYNIILGRQGLLGLSGIHLLVCAIGTLRGRHYYAFSFASPTGIHRIGPNRNLRAIHPVRVQGGYFAPSHPGAPTFNRTQEASSISSSGSTIWADLL